MAFLFGFTQVTNATQNLVISCFITAVQSRPLSDDQGLMCRYLLWGSVRNYLGTFAHWFEGYWVWISGWFESNWEYHGEYHRNIWYVEMRALLIG